MNCSNRSGRKALHRLVEASDSTGRLIAMDDTLGDISLDDADGLGQFGHGGRVVAFLDHRAKALDLVPHPAPEMPVPRTTHGVLTHSLHGIFMVGHAVSSSHREQASAKRRDS